MLDPMFVTEQIRHARPARIVPPMFIVPQFESESDPESAPFRRPGQARSASTPGITCAKCNLRESCLSGEVAARDLERIESIVYVRRRIQRGETLFRFGDAFKCLYAIRSGFFKTSHADVGRREQITGFFMAGELLGLGGMASGHCEVTATALEDSEVCAMPFSLIEQIAAEVPALQRGLLSVLSREIVRDHGVMLLLGSMCAEERVAAFLINLSRRFARRGYSATQLRLRMSRSEIASYLGLKLETVSRIFSLFHRNGLLEVQKRQIAIVNARRLEAVLTGPEWRNNHPTMSDPGRTLPDWLRPAATG